MRADSGTSVELIAETESIAACGLTWALATVYTVNAADASTALATLLLKDVDKFVLRLRPGTARINEPMRFQSQRQNTQRQVILIGDVSQPTVIDLQKNNLFIEDSNASANLAECPCHPLKHAGPVKTVKRQRRV